MVTEKQRKFIIFMIRMKLWRVEIQMRKPSICACRGTKWILKIIEKSQVVDNLKHAPCCPANHWHRQRLVFHKCTCYATVEMSR